MNIHLLGGGSMAAAIAGGLVRQGGHRVHTVNWSREERGRLAEELGVSVSEKLPELTTGDVLVLAVKPQDMQVTCQGMQTSGALVLSVAAGLSIATLSRYLGRTRRIVRVTPNMPGKTGLGVSGTFTNDSVFDQDKAAADSIMRTVGITVWLDDEERPHDTTGISGSGSAYVFYLPDVLKQAVRQQGFDEKEAHRLSLATFRGAVALADQTGEDLAVLQQSVTSKGDTTHEAIEAFKAGQVVETVVKGVTACVNRSREPAKRFEAVQK